MTIINLFANIILGYSLTMFYIYLYGDSSKIVNKWSFVGHWTLKLGLMTVILATLFNIVYFNHVSLPQTIMNTGLALIFIWAYLFHQKLLKTKK